MRFVSTTNHSHYLNLDILIIAVRYTRGVGDFSNQRKKSATWRQDRNFIVVTICFHFYHLLISIFPCIHCCTSLTDLSSNISITASDDIEQLRDSNARLNRKWIFAKITKRVSFFNIHNHSRNSISNDIQVMLSNNYNARYQLWDHWTHFLYA